MAVAPIAPNLLEWENGAPRLVGGRRRADAKIVFPFPAEVDDSLYEKVLLSPRGSLWSFTIQRFRPKSPPYAGADDETTFKPFAVGYVELAGEVIVEARIESSDFAALRIGMPMRLAVRLFSKATGVEALTYVFEPELAA